MCVSRSATFLCALLASRVRRWAFSTRMWVNSLLQILPSGVWWSEWCFSSRQISSDDRLQPDEIPPNEINKKGTTKYVRTYVRLAPPFLWSWWYSIKVRREMKKCLDTFRNGEKGRVNGWIQSTVEEHTIEFETELQRRKMTEKRDVYRWSLLIFTGLYTFFFAGKDWPCMFSS